MYELIRIMHDSLLPFFPVKGMRFRICRFQRIEPHDLFGFLLAFFRSLHVTDDCAARIGSLGQLAAAVVVAFHFY